MCDAAFTLMDRPYASGANAIKIAYASKHLLHIDIYFACTKVRVLKVPFQAQSADTCLIASALEKCVPIDTRDALRYAARAHSVLGASL